MKIVSSYILLPMVICVYLFTNLGFEVHTCSKNGTSITMLISGKAAKCCCSNRSSAPNSEQSCCCAQNDDSTSTGCCGSGDGPCKCCHSSVYVLDEAQNITDYTIVADPTVVVSIPFQAAFLDTLFTYEDAAAVAFHAARLLFGPGRGLSAITPLRL